MVLVNAHSAEVIGGVVEVPAVGGHAVPHRRLEVEAVQLAHFVYKGWQSLEQNYPMIPSKQLAIKKKEKTKPMEIELHGKTFYITGLLHLTHQRMFP